MISNATISKSASVARIKEDIQPGEINCRYWGTTSNDVNYYTCTQLATKYSITVEKFFELNPNVNPDCGNLQPHTKYCVKGFIAPLRATDGKCGPPNNNARSLGTELQCCNAETWTCGYSEVDCGRGTCYEGQCPGDKVYSTDGTCGYQHGNRLCAGKWGDCCNMDGVCGTGPDFCGTNVCQMGNCTMPPPQETPWPWLSGNTTDSTCGGPNHYTCHAAYVNCCNKDGICGSGISDCAVGCQPQFGDCDSTTTITPSAASSSTTSSVASSSSTAAASPTNTMPCTGGTRAEGFSDGLLDLCLYSCDYNHCAADVCVCTRYESEAVPAPTGTNQHGCPGTAQSGYSEYSYYADLCEFTCSHGYCPEGACKPC